MLDPLSRMMGEPSSQAVASESQDSTRQTRFLEPRDLTFPGVIQERLCVGESRMGKKGHPWGTKT